MPRRPRTTIIEPDETDPITGAIIEDTAATADQLVDILEQLRGYEVGDIKGVLYKVPKGGGKYEWIEEVAPPFKPGEMMEMLKERFGGGDFQLRIFAKGRIAKNVQFSIAAERSPLVAPDTGKADTMTLFQIMMAQQADARRDSQAAADRQMQMMAQQQATTMQMFATMSQQTTALMTAAFGSREKISDLAAVLRPPQEGNKLTETLEVLKTAKGLFAGSEGGGFDPDDLVKSAASLAGPVIAAAGRYVQERRQTPQVEGMDYTALPAPEGQLMLPGVPPAEPAPGVQFHPVISVIRDDVLFLQSRNANVELAAELVLERLEENGVTEGQVNELVAQVSQAPDPWAALAALGLDVRGNIVWAARFLQALSELQADPGGDADDTGGGGGGALHLADDGDPGASGVAADRD